MVSVFTEAFLSLTMVMALVLSLKLVHYVLVLIQCFYRRCQHARKTL